MLPLRRYRRIPGILLEISYRLVIEILFRRLLVLRSPNSFNGLLR